MGFMLYYTGGPRDAQTEKRPSAPETIRLDAQQAGGVPGVYLLDHISGVKAFFVWKPKPLPGADDTPLEVPRFLRGLNRQR